MDFNLIVSLLLVFSTFLVGVAEILLPKRARGRSGQVIKRRILDSEFVTLLILISVTFFLSICNAYQTYKSDLRTADVAESTQIEVLSQSQMDKIFRNEVEERLGEFNLGTTSYFKKLESSSSEISTAVSAAVRKIEAEANRSLTAQASSLSNDQLTSMVNSYFKMQDVSVASIRGTARRLDRIWISVRDEQLLLDFIRLTGQDLSPQFEQQVVDEYKETLKELKVDMREVIASFKVARTKMLESRLAAKTRYDRCTEKTRKRLVALAIDQDFFATPDSSILAGEAVRLSREIDQVLEADSGVRFTAGYLAALLRSVTDLGFNIAEEIEFSIHADKAFQSASFLIARMQASRDSTLDDFVAPYEDGLGSSAASTPR